MRTAGLVTIPKAAEIVAVVVALTAVVFTVNVPDFLPAATLTEVGTLAEGALLDSDITGPPEGATEFMVTVPVLDFPPLTELGLRVSEIKEGALIVSVAACEEPPCPIRATNTRTKPRLLAAG